MDVLPQTVFGAYKSRQEVDVTVRLLISHGFLHTDISTLMPYRAGGGMAGGVTASLMKFGMSEEEAGRFESYISNGRILVSVHTNDTDSAQEAKQVLGATGALEICVAGNPMPGLTRTRSQGASQQITSVSVS